MGEVEFFRKIRVLIVDDNLSDRLILKAALTRLKFKDISEAEDGSIAMAKIETAAKMNDPIQLVFLDWQMPKRKGIRVLEDLKKIRQFKDVRVIMITNVSDDTSVKEALMAGVDEYILKPIELDVVKSKLEKLGLGGSS